MFRRLAMVSGRIISAILQQATAQGTRSTILRPLQWMTLLLGLALIGALRYQAPTWLLIALFILFLLPVFAVLFGFFYCLLSGKTELVEALRTEHYSIQKLAIEKGFVGDSLTGVFPPETVEAKLLGEPRGGVAKEEKQ